MDEVVCAATVAAVTVVFDRSPQDLVSSELTCLTHNHRKIIYFVCVRHGNFQNQGCRHGSFFTVNRVKDRQKHITDLK